MMMMFVLLLLCCGVGDDQLYYYAYSIVADTNFNKKKIRMERRNKNVDVGSSTILVYPTVSM